MGPGHLGVGLAAKRVAPQTPVIVLLVASEILDILFFVFMFSGLERAGKGSDRGHIPWSHGLFMASVWSVVAGAVVFLFSRDRRLSIVNGLVVFSHWVLDFIAHDPDLPVFFDGSPRVGLGLEWSHTANGLVVHWARGLLVEISLLVGGIFIYLNTRRRMAASARSSISIK